MNIVIVLLAAFFVAYRGWQAGFVRLVLRLLTVVLAYALAVKETPRLSQYFVDQGWLPVVLAWPLASLCLFVFGSLLFSLAARGLVYWLPEHWLQAGKGLGGVAGLALGCLLGLLVVWGVGMLQDAWRLRVAGQAATGYAALESVHSSLPDKASSPDEVSWGEEASLSQMDRRVRAWSGHMVAEAVEQVLGDSPAAQTASRWVEQPLSMAEGLQHFASKPELRALFQNPANFAVLVSGDSNKILQLENFQAVLHDERCMQFLAAAGLSGATPETRAVALADILGRYARNFDKLRHTEEFQALSQDVALREKLQQGNLLMLLTDPKVRRLTEMLAQGNWQPAATSASSSTATALSAKQGATTAGVEVEPAAPAKLLYRWRDSKGHLHITEQKPPADVTADVIKP